MKKMLIFFITILLVLSLFSACTGDNKKVDEENNEEGIEENSGEIVLENTEESHLVIGIGGEPTSVDPHNALGTPTATLVFHLYNSLTRTNENGEVVGDLAKSYESIDDLTWQFELKENVTFHNGEPFNSETVKYSIERMLNPDLSFPLSADYSFIKEVEVIDDNTVNIVTNYPYAGFPLRMFYLPMVPKNYIEENGNDFFVSNPIGTGPYKLISWEKGNKVELQAFENYFEGKPNIEKITYKTIPEDSSRVAALEAGEVDIISGVPTSQIERMNNNNDLKIIGYPTSRVMFVGMNIMNSDILKDKRVRQAMNYAVNVDEIIDEVLEGNGTKVATISAPQYNGYSDNIKPYEHDIEKARDLLEEAGYKDGFTIDLAFSPGKYMNSRDIMLVLANQLKEVGINVNIIEQESGLQTTEILSKQIEPLYFSGIGGPYADLELIARISFGTDQRYSTYSNDELDALREQANKTVDKERADKIWEDYQILIKEEAPAIFMYQLYDIYAYNDNIKNWKPRIDQMILSYGIEIEK